MEQNLVDAELAQADLDLILTSLDTVKSKLPFLISITDEQKKKLFKAGEALLPLIDVAAEVVEKFPQIMSGTFDAAGYKRDVSLKNGLQSVSEKLEILQKGVGDTLTAVNSDSLISSMEVYYEAKSKEKKVPGLSVLVDKMREFFKKGGGGNPTPPEPGK